MKIKKWISWLLCVVVFFTGCAGKQVQSQVTVEPTKQTVQQAETDPTETSEDNAAESSTPTEKPKESETRWENTTEPVEVTEAPAQGPAGETEPTAEPTAEPTEPTEVEDEDPPEANTEPGWGALQ